MRSGCNTTPTNLVLTRLSIGAASALAIASKTSVPATRAFLLLYYPVVTNNLRRLLSMAEHTIIHIIVGAWSVYAHI